MQKNQSGNPAFSKSALSKIGDIESSKSATIMGTTIKIFVLLAFTIFAATFGWQAAVANSSSLVIVIVAGGIIGFIAALITVLNPKFAVVSGPIYALVQGYVLGAVSQMYNVQFDGIVLQTVALTGALFFSALLVFSAGLIKVTDKFRTGVIIATGGIAIYYLITMFAGMFGFHMPLMYNTGTLGIAISAFIIFIATLNLILDFDMIQKLEQNKAPKTFEWYGAFALMVTLIWLYFEVLRLIANLRG
jgi:uncharacterized YccA/Bax inhibitor family protein